MIHHKNSFFTKRIQFLTPVLQNGLILIWSKLALRKNKPNIELFPMHQAIPEYFLS
jgi:hypothetical protein